jgi:hypothetical protein
MRGSCSCGSVQYQINGDIKSIVNCHCKLCRKMNGSAFSTYVAVLESDFELIQGNLKTYQATALAQKSFCTDCGTPIYNTNPKYAGLRILHLGSLDDPDKLQPQVNIYCESRLDWLGHVPPMADRKKGFGS